MNKSLFNIAVDGTQCTGKTTLFNRLRADKLGYNYIPELGSILARNKYCVNSSKDWDELFTNPLKYSRFIHELLETQIIEEKNEPFLADSSLFRICTYAVLNNVHIDRDIFTNCHYDIIFYCPIEWEYISDNFRTDKLRVEVDKKLRQLLQERFTNKLVYLYGTEDDRIFQVKNTLGLI